VYGHARLQRTLHAATGFFRAVAQAHRPVGRMLLVVARLLLGLGGDGGQFGIGG
jgi:hypothetical protein